ncbi:hypothetical protein BH24ACT3_BH24ACT3_08860 [soil metagenome]
MTLARILGAVGRTLVGTGTLVLLFVAYQLWGTGIREARAQDDLRDQFTAQLEQAAEATPPSTTATTAQPPEEGPPETLPATPVPAQAPPPAGDPVGVIAIPAIGVEKVFLEGVALSYLKDGPGHFPGTPMPGQAGNAAIAGHRTTYGAPFHNLDQLSAGDEIIVTTLQGEFTYEMTEQLVVEPSQVEVLEDKGDNRLTLAACHPKFSAAERIIVYAEMVGEPAPAPLPDLALPEGEVAAAPEVESLDGEEVSQAPAYAWGAGALAVGLVIWLLARTQRERRLRYWLVYAASAPVLLIVLFFFFESFARLLPAAY